MSNNNLLNHAHVKATALRMVRDMRPGWDAKRVSKKFVDELELYVLNKIRGAIMHHPTIGKTIMYVI